MLAMDTFSLHMSENSLWKKTAIDAQAKLLAELNLIMIMNLS